MWRFYNDISLRQKNCAERMAQEGGGWGFPEGYVFSRHLIRDSTPLGRIIPGLGYVVNVPMVSQVLSPRPGAMWDPLPNRLKNGLQIRIDTYIYIYQDLPRGAKWLLKGCQLTIPLRVYLAPEMEGPGTHIYIYIFTSIPYPAVIHCGPMTTVTARPAVSGEWWMRWGHPKDLYPPLKLTASCAP